MPEGRVGSYWLETAQRRRYPPLAGAAAVDVAVVGGGIAGLTAAWLLKREGRRVAVLEAGRILDRVTGRTTAKISALHGLRYASMASAFGRDAARLYGEANQQAIERIAEAVAELGVECGFERKAAYVFSSSGRKLDAIRQEAEIARQLGLPAAFVREIPLPVASAGAVRFEGQAQFHPVRFLAGMAEAIDGDGSAVHEDTRVLDVAEGEPCRVETERGALEAAHAIVATNLPILDRGGFFAKAFPTMHTVLAARIEEEGAPDGMFLAVDDPEFSARTHRDEHGLVLISDGRAFKTGHERDVEAAHAELETLVRRCFRVRALEWRWANQDYATMDGVPYVGQPTPMARRIHVATGFNHWGMTNSMVAAQILRDAVLGRPNPWAELYAATRVKPAVSAPAFLKENLDVARQWIGGRLGGGEAPVEALRPGEGAVLKIGGERCAVSRGDDGRLTALSARCTHMGCTVAWNGLERTWDCPCHGSRFAAEDGRVLNGPAVRPLAPKTVAAEAAA
jgi:glycine/D-amino acid oxidase-like deaminating enzyme/nitrite reductase/ring-hydroxylating ferredoxin subunit